MQSVPIYGNGGSESPRVQIPFKFAYLSAVVTVRPFSAKYFAAPG